MTTGHRPHIFRSMSNLEKSEQDPQATPYSRRELFTAAAGVGAGALGAMGLLFAVANERAANAYQNQGVEEVGANNKVARGDLTTAQTKFNNEVPRVAASSGLLTAGVATLVGLAIKRRAVRAAENTQKDSKS